MRFTSLASMIFILWPAVVWAGTVSFQHEITVGPAGADFTSIQAAIDSVGGASSATNRYLISVASGTYAEQIKMNQPYTTLRGAGIGGTIIAKDVWTGYAAGSGVLMPLADNVTVENLTVFNTLNDFLHHSAIALSTNGQSPKNVVFNNVYFTTAWKDTLWMSGGGSYIFNDCLIDGAYDIMTLVNNGSYVFRRLTAVTWGGGGGNQFFWTANSPQITVSDSSFHSDFWLTTYLAVHNSADPITINFNSSELSAPTERGGVDWVVPNGFHPYVSLKRTSKKDGAVNAVPSRSWNKYE